MENQKGWTPNRPRYINLPKPTWLRSTRKPQAILVMRYLASEAGSRLRYLEAEGEGTDGWNILDSTNRDIFDSLKSKNLSPWKTYPVAKNGITRALTELESVGLISTFMPTGKLRLIGIGINQEELKGSTRVAQGEHKGSTRVAQGEHKGSTRVALRVAQGEHKGSTRVAQGEHKGSINSDSTATNKDHTASKVTEGNIKEGEFGIPIENNQLLEPQEESIIEVDNDSNVVKLEDMHTEGEPNVWDTEKIKALEDFVLALGEKWGFTGGLDNNELNLEEWINSPLHKEFVSPWLSPEIHYTDFRDLPDIYSPKTFSEFGVTPLSVQRLNRILLPKREDTRELAMTIYGMYAQPFDNPYLNPKKKGLAFIRMYPFGFHVRDAWIHPWSPPLIPWAAVAHDADLMARWNKKYWHQGKHPFEPQRTTQGIREAIAHGNKEMPDDPFFDTARYDSLDVKGSLPGARSSILAHPELFQLLYWYCGTIGVSPSVMVDAYKRWETYSGAFPGLDLRHPSNANADKIKMFGNYLKYAMWGDSKRGSYLPREQGENKSLSSAEGQEWHHQGVLGGTTVLVRCHDGQMREVWLTDYQKYVYDLKFHPKSDTDKEILDSLIAELL